MTIDAPCPNCGTIYTVRRDLIGKRTKCTRCGTPFVIVEGAPLQPPPTNPPQPPPAQPQPVPDQLLYGDIPIHQSYAAQPIPPAAQQPARHYAATSASVGAQPDKPNSRYPVIRMVAKGYEVLAVLVLIFAAIMLVVGIVQVILNPESILRVLVSSGMMCVWGLATALMCLFFSQVIRLFLQIEQNTRETSEACRQLADDLTAIQTEQ